MKKDITAPQQAAMALFDDMAKDAGMGLEGADKDSYAIPFLQILQGLSPQLETVEGARPGLFINSITQEIFKEALVIPCGFQRRYLRWAPRDAGGGFKGDLSPIEVDSGKIGAVKDSEGRLRLDGDELKDTRNHFVLVQNAMGAWSPALLSLSSTQIKRSKRWLSLISGIELRDANGRAFTPPSFSHIYRLSGVKEENAKGSWWGVNVEILGTVTDKDVYNKAREFSRQVSAGEVKAAEPVAEESDF